LTGVFAVAQHAKAETYMLYLQLDKIKSLPPVEEMTEEMYTDYFPQYALKPAERPTFFPHTKSYQPENDSHAFK
jgi:ATP synthase D chain, mitochondrial (ATP5H)